MADLSKIEAELSSLTILEAFGLPGSDRTLGQGLAFIRDHQCQINSNDSTEAAAGFAGTDRRVK